MTKVDLRLDLGHDPALKPKRLETCQGGCTCERRRRNWTPLLCGIASGVWMMRLPHASPQPDHPPNTVRACMWPHVQMRAVQGMRARRGVVDARVRSCHGVLGAHRSKERLSEHAGRDRVGVIVVRRLQGEAAIEGSPDFLQRYLFTVTRGGPANRENAKAQKVHEGDRLRIRTPGCS